MRVVAAALVVLVLALARAAGADVISEEQAQCNGKSAGDTCGTDGACVTETCSRAHPDGTSSSWPCLVCRPGAPGSSGSSRSLVIGIVVAVVLIAGGVGFAYGRRRKGAS